MMAYVVQNVDGNEDLLVNLEMTKSEVVVAQELDEEGASLRKSKEDKKVSQVEARRSVEKKVTMEAKKEKTKEKVIQLRQELQDPPGQGLILCISLLCSVEA